MQLPSSDGCVERILRPFNSPKELAEMSTYREQLLASRDKGLDAYAKTLAAHPSTQALECTIGSIAIAPIKSLGMISLQDAVITSRGLMSAKTSIYDRSIMLGRMVSGEAWQFDRFSQRQEPALAAAHACLEGRNVVYTATGMEPLILSAQDFEPSNHHVNYTLRMTSDNDVYSLCQAQMRITSWVRKLVSLYGSGKYDVSSIYALCPSLNFVRKVEQRHACGIKAQTLLTDGGQLLVTSESTLHWLNGQLAAAADDFVPLEMDAFRPNIVLNGLPPNMEDVISCMNVDNNFLYFGDLSVRCSVTGVNQRTGKQRTDKQPLAGLRCRPSRPPENDGVTFGVNCVFNCTGLQTLGLRVGDRGFVQEEK